MTWTRRDPANPGLGWPARGATGSVASHQFFLERTFERIRNYHAVTGRYPDIDASTYELYSFFGALKLIYDRLSQTGQARLRSSIRDGLKDEKGLGPIAAEFRMATHLMARGFDVDFTDIEYRERYDLLATKDNLKIEIDCKAPSGDVGRKIHGHRFRVFANELMPSLRDFVSRGGGHLILITVPSRLHADDIQSERNLIKQSIEALNGQTEARDLLEMRSFELLDSPFNDRSITPAQIADFLDRKFALSNVNAACDWQPGHGAAVLVVQRAITSCH